MLTKNELFREAHKVASEMISNFNRDLVVYSIAQSELASYAHIDTGNLSKILSGVTFPNLKTFCRLNIAINSIIQSKIN